jgi:hypothetical protein
MPGPGIPEIKWGTVADPGGVAHIVPVIETVIMKGHRLSISCACGPRLEKSQDYLIVIHYVIH